MAVARAAALDFETLTKRPSFWSALRNWRARSSFPARKSKGLETWRRVEQDFDLLQRWWTCVFGKPAVVARAAVVHS